MSLHSQEKQRLRQRFNRRMQQRHRQYAAQQHHATRLSHDHHLGDIVGIFAITHHPQNLLYRLGKGCFSLSILAFCLCLCFLSDERAYLLAQYPVGVIPMQSLLILVPCIGGLTVGSMLLGTGKHVRWLFAYTGGLAYDPPSLGSMQIIRWSDVQDVQGEWMMVPNPDAEFKVDRPSLRTYHVHLRDGSDIPLEGAFANLLNPYLAVHSLPAIVVPWVMYYEIPHVPSLEQVFARYAKPLPRWDGTLSN